MPKTIFSGAYRDLVAVLVDLRKSAGITQAELADRLGKDQSFVSLVENAQRRVDVIEFCAICRALGADPKSVFGRLVDALPA